MRFPFTFRHSEKPGRSPSSNLNRVRCGNSQQVPRKPCTEAELEYSVERPKGRPASGNCSLILPLGELQQAGGECHTIDFAKQSSESRAGIRTRCSISASGNSPQRISAAVIQLSWSLVSDGPALIDAQSSRTLRGQEEDDPIDNRQFANNDDLSEAGGCMEHEMGNAIILDSTNTSGRVNRPGTTGQPPTKHARRPRVSQTPGRCLSPCAP